MTNVDIADEDDVAVIKSLRSQSNSAIDRKDVGGVLAVLRNDARVIVGAGQLCDGSAAMGQFLHQAFADPEFITATRHTHSVHVSGETAAEEGEWQVRLKAKTTRGKYLARWQREQAGWRIAAELFIPLESEDVV